MTESPSSPSSGITVLLRPAELDGDLAEIEGASYRHLFRARRLRSGVRLRVVDGEGRARWAEVEKIERHRAVLSLAAPAPDNEPAYRLHLEVAALRAERASWLVEKATEIGVRGIRFIATERTPRKVSPANLERLRRVARAAVEQSHRSRVPEISGVEPWETVIASLSDSDSADDRYVLDPGAGSQNTWSARGGSGLVLIGPEGGFSRAETQQLEELGCRAVSLGSRTLRVETAATVAAAKLLL